MPQRLRAGLPTLLLKLHHLPTGGHVCAGVEVPATAGYRRVTRPGGRLQTCGVDWLDEGYTDLDAVEHLLFGSLAESGTQLPSLVGVDAGNGISPLARTIADLTAGGRTAVPAATNDRTVAWIRPAPGTVFQGVVDFQRADFALTEKLLGEFFGEQASAIGERRRWLTRRSSTWAPTRSRICRCEIPVGLGLATNRMARPIRLCFPELNRPPTRVPRLNAYGGVK